MRNLITDNRLPEFTEEEAAIVKGSYDFMGLNHYTTKYVHYSGEVGKDYGNDGRFWESSTDINGNLIGPYADSTWLNVYPLGLRKLLNWIDKRYNHP
jgi:beta-glucosidase